MNLSDEIRKQIEKNKGLKLAVGEINNHLSILENLVRKDIMEQVDEAYQKGLEEGKKAFDLLDSERNSEYQRGLSEGNDIGYKDGVNDGQNEAWEAARKIVCDESFDSSTLMHIFNRRSSFDGIIGEFSASEAIEKLKAYEEKHKADDKIEVGDEVRRKSASENERGGIVTKDWENSYFIMWTDGSSGQWDKDKVVKTGRHFDIDKILEEMRT